MRDLIIVGAGPAGSTLARLLGRELDILVLDGRGQPGPAGQAGLPGPAKCCGGLLDPDAQKCLAAFGLGLPLGVAADPQVFQVRAMDLDNGLERRYQRHYVNVDRAAFDRWLQSLIPPGVELIPGASYLSHAESASGIRVSYRLEGKLVEEDCRCLVGADGAQSMVRRHCSMPGPDPLAPAYVAIQEAFPRRGNPDWYGAIFCREVTDFYAWTIPKGEVLLLGCALRAGREAPQRFGRLKELLEGQGLDLGRPRAREAAWLQRPGLGRASWTGRGRLALVGEAAGFISPSSAEGFSYAFRSALALAEALQDGPEGPWQARYRAKTAALRANLAFKSLKSPFMYHPLLRGLIMASGLMAIPSLGREP